MARRSGCAVPLDEETGPRVVFADGTQSIYLADMTGDGLSDLVRIRNGEVCYWPNLGYGRFGAKVDDGPTRRGSTPRTCSIRSASGWPTPTARAPRTSSISDATASRRLPQRSRQRLERRAARLRQFPAVDSVASITVADFLGRGTACLVWSSPLPADADRQLRYVDLMCGQKPHLLIRTVNNLGAETRITYASSTEFYLADKAAGSPWITRLPFPVHVVERVETLRLPSAATASSPATAIITATMTASSASSAASAGSTSSIREEIATLTANGALPAGAQYRRGLARSPRC